MSCSSQNTLFRSIANRLVGHWYNFENDGGYVFSLCHSLGEPAQVRHFGNNHSFDSRYTLFLNQENIPVIIFGHPGHEPEFQIKVLVRGMLILQSNKNNVNIFERRADIEFANGIIKDLELI